jgi:hypothetical protein
MYAKPCDKIMTNAPATIAWLTGETFSDADLSATWLWSVSDRGFLLTGWTYVVTFVPIGVFGLAGFTLNRRLYKGKFGSKKAKTSRSSKIRV